LNTKDLLRKVVRELHRAGIEVLVGGGWAEELLGITAKRSHKDIDLYCCGDNFQKVDAYLRANRLEELPAKHLPHKRAFLQDGVMVEVVLIQKDEAGFFSDFWHEKIIRWPAPLVNAEKIGGVPCLSPEALAFYRAMHAELFRSR
jgi:Aminoglycoside-2''-adenylyltransferase